jgi:adenosylhomocysteine nucleosidase
VNLPTPVLVCFAVKEEAKFFSPDTVTTPCSSLITGIGRRNAERSVRQALDTQRPGLVITAGFCGGLNPKLAVGTVLFEADDSVANLLVGTGAMAGRFHCAEKVVVNAAKKTELWKTTGADAVEMESGAIRAICRERQITSATVRVISDAANEDLPLDFNALMTADEKIDYGKLARTLAFSPAKLPALLRFQQQTITAAQALAAALYRSFGSSGG